MPNTDTKEPHSLRGHDSKSTNSVGIIMQLKGFFSSFSTSLASIQHHHHAGDTEKASEELKTVVGDVQSFIKTNKDSNVIAGVDDDLSEALQNSNVFDDFDSIGLQDVSDSMLGDLVKSEAFDGLTDLSR